MSNKRAATLAAGLAVAVALYLVMTAQGAATGLAIAVSAIIFIAISATAAGRRSS